MIKPDINYVDISHSIGMPFGGIGTGYFAYGRHGFVNENFDGFPEPEQTSTYPRGDLWNYLNENPKESDFLLYLQNDNKKTLLQTRKSSFTDGIPALSHKMYAYMPFGISQIECNEETNVELLMYSSLKPHDVDRTHIPSTVFEITIENKTDRDINYQLGFCVNEKKYLILRKNNYLYLEKNSGNVTIGFVDGQNEKKDVTVKAKSSKTAVAVMSWYFPFFRTQGIAPDDIIFRHNKDFVYDKNKNIGDYQRNYTLKYKSSLDVFEMSVANYKLFKSDIEEWHNSIKAPESFSKIWFSSYASAITATLYTVEGFFFEIEQPHGCINTMDVSVYSTWIYMINWPQLEKQDLYQFVLSIPKSGETKGKVWHSLWADGAHYVEEAIYAVRIWRYVLWSRDTEFLSDAYESVKLALEYIYLHEGRGSLINNVEGNQSYDAWKMPGIDAYVNNQWIYALFSYVEMSKKLCVEPLLNGINAEKLLSSAIEEYNDILWDEKDGYWHAYKTNEFSVQLPFGDAVFSDQLFGHWAVAIDKNSRNVMNSLNEERALEKIYTHNRIEDKDGQFSCWTNGMMPNRQETYKIHNPNGDYHECGYHALTCWVSTQMEMASMLAYFKKDNESIDVFNSVSKAMGRNVLAVGEWNRMVSKDLLPVTADFEPGKDTPRFPPYPRYKSSWEYITRIIGIELDFDNIYFSPMKNVDFEIKNMYIAGTFVTLKIEKNWTRVMVNKSECEPILNRNVKTASISFIK